MSDVLDFRYAERKDGGLILKFIKDLAKYEKMEKITDTGSLPVPYAVSVYCFCREHCDSRWFCHGHR